MESKVPGASPTQYLLFFLSFFLSAFFPVFFCVVVFYNVYLNNCYLIKCYKEQEKYRVSREKVVHRMRG